MKMPTLIAAAAALSGATQADPLSQRELWTENFTAGVQGTIVGDESVALLQSDGKFMMLSLADGKKTIIAFAVPVAVKIHVSPAARGVAALVGIENPRRRGSLPAPWQSQTDS